MKYRIENLKASSSLLSLLKTYARITYERGQYEYVLRHGTISKEIVMEKLFGKFCMVSKRYPISNDGLARAIDDMKAEMGINSDD